MAVVMIGFSFWSAVASKARYRFGSPAAPDPKRRRRFALPAHSKLFSQTAPGQMQKQIFQTGLGYVRVRNHHALFACQAHDIGEQAFGSISVDAHLIMIRIYLDHAGERSQSARESLRGAIALANLQLD